MTYCRICGENTSVYTCGKCVANWRSLLRQAIKILPEMHDEIAKTSVKAKTGGNSGTTPEAIGLTALEAKHNLDKSIYRLYKQIGATDPKTAHKKLHHIQETPKDKEALHDDYTSMENAIKTCTSIIETREPPITIGLCKCGHTLKARPSQTNAKCPNCKHTAALADFAERRRLNAIARVQGRRLSRSEASLFISVALPGAKPVTVRKWFSRHLKGDDEGFYSEQMLRDFVEERVKKYAVPVAQ